MSKTIRPGHNLLYDLPLIGDDLAQIGRVINILSNPCAPNAEVWVYALFHAIPSFAISVFKPEIVDINIPHRGRGTRKGRRMNFFANVIRRGTIFEIPVPRWQVFRLYEFSQRIGWYFLVFDATTDLVVNWTSMAYQWGGCPGVPTTPAWQCSGGWPTTSTTGPGWKGYIHWTVDMYVKSSPAPDQAAMRVLQECTPMFSLHATQRQHPLDPNARIAAWRIVTPSSPTPIWEGETGLDDQGRRSISGASIPVGSFSDGQLARVEYYVENGNIVGVDDFSWSMTSADVPGIWPDP